MDYDLSLDLSINSKNWPIGKPLPVQNKIGLLTEYGVQNRTLSTAVFSSLKVLVLNFLSTKP
jgi:hypothetical protein